MDAKESPASELPPLAKTAEVALYLRASEALVRELVREHKLHALKVGRSLRIPREAVLAFVAGDSVKPNVVASNDNGQRIERASA